MHVCIYIYREREIYANISIHNNNVNNNNDNNNHHNNVTSNNNAITSKRHAENGTADIPGY